MSSEYGSSHTQNNTAPPHAQNNTAPPHTQSISDTDNRQWSAMTEVRGIAISGLVLSIIFMLGLIAFVTWYWIEGGQESTSEKIKQALEESIDTSPVFKKLTVNEDTTLGTNSSDTLNVKAAVSSNLIPDGQKTRDLGSSTRRWDDLYVDQINFDGGISIVSETDIIKFTGGGLGYKRVVQPLTISGTSPVDNVYPINSGYIYKLNHDGTETSNSILLPTASGSGDFFEFIFDDDFPGDLYFTTAENDSMRGVASITAQPFTSDDLASGVSYAQFASLSTGSSSFTINFSKPVDNTTYPGVINGSKVTFLDEGSNLWYVNADLIVDGRSNSSEFRNPIFKSVS
jgi:hypothetical protein